MSSETLRIDLLLRRLVSLGGEVRDLLAAGDWEGALPIQDEFDESFAAMQMLVERGVQFTPEHATDLAQLQRVHGENERLTIDLHRSAGFEIGNLSTVRKVGNAYSPLGQNHRPSPRYVDGSA